MMSFRELPGRIDVDELMAAAFALSLSAKDIDALAREYAAIRDAGYPHAGASAGFGVRAHAREAATAAAARAVGRRNGGR